MDAVTYPNESLVDFLNENIIALRVQSDTKPMADDYNVTWTPALIVLDQEGKELHRTVGFLSPEDLIPSILLGMGNGYFNANEFAQALEVYGRIIDEYPDSDWAPEAIFQKGVSTYKHTENPLPLREAYDVLLEKYPTSQWTKRAYPYRLIGE